MKTELLLVRDGLEGAAPWMAQVLREAGFAVRTTSSAELDDIAPAEVVLLRISDRNPTAACWTLHRQGYRWIVAVSGSPSSQECIRLLNAGADYYMDAWLPAEELVARVKVVLRFSAWLAESYDHGTLGHQPIPNTAGSRTHQ
jgi:DNA-binding response OmpR family regulator